MPKLHNIMPQVAITPWSVESLQSKLNPLGLASVGSVASAVYPSANLAIYVPFSVVTPLPIAQIFWYNGATASGNVDAGIYDSRRKKIISTGSTVQAGVNALQVVNVTDTWIGSGLYFLAIAMDNVTGTLFSGAAAGAFWHGIVGIYQQATAFTLPATATFATPASDYLPFFGFTPRGVI